MKSYPVKEKYTDSMVSKILCYRQTSCYFIIRIKDKIDFLPLASRGFIPISGGSGFEPIHKIGTLALSFFFYFGAFISEGCPSPKEISS